VTTYAAGEPPEPFGSPVFRVMPRFAGQTRPRFLLRRTLR